MLMPYISCHKPQSLVWSKLLVEMLHLAAACTKYIIIFTGCCYSSDIWLCAHVQLFLKRIKGFAYCGGKCKDIKRCWWKVELQVMENKFPWISAIVTCILTSKEKDSSECQKYGFKSTMLYMMAVKPVESWHKKQTCGSVVTSTWTCKIKTWFVQVVFADCSAFRTDHYCTSFILKGFFTYGEHLKSVFTKFNLV